MQKTKLSDVARLAGVSVATVSRVINLPASVSVDLRARVEEARTQLNYIPNPAGRALASRRMSTVGAIVPTLGTAIFPQWVVALQQGLERRGFSLLLSSSEYDPATELVHLKTLLNRGIDAVVLIGSDHLPETYALLKEQQLPALCAFASQNAGGLPCVGFDQKQASRDLADYLVRLGHREIGVISSPMLHNDRIRLRIEGIADALNSVGATLEPKYIVEVPYSLGSGRRALGDIMALSPRVTAVMCTTDLLAVGALLEAGRRGYSVPGDISITGFDDLDIAAHMQPALTTVNVPAAEIGVRCADLIADAVIGRRESEGAHFVTRTVVRDSSGRPHP